MQRLSWLITVTMVVGIPLTVVEVALTQEVFQAVFEEKQIKQAQNTTAQRSEADRLIQQGIQQYRTNQSQAALQSWQQALELYRAIGNRRGELAALGNQGIVYRSLGQYQRAIDFYLQALDIAREVGDRQAEASVLGNLGIVYRALGQYQRAIDFHQQHLDIARDIGDRQGEATSLGGLALAYDALGQYQHAIDFHQQHLAISRNIGDRWGEAASLGNLGNVYDALGQYQRAIDFHQQSLDIAREIGDRRGEASSLGNLGNVYDALGQYQRAIDFHQQSLDIDRAIGDRRGEAASLGNLGLAYYSLGQYQRAVNFHQQHLDIARDIGDRRGEANALGNLGLAYDALGQYQPAIDFYQQQLAITRAIGDRQGEVNALGNLGLIYDVLGQYQRAIDLHQQSLAQTRTIGDRQGEAASLGNLGLAHYSLGQYQQAINFYQQSLVIIREIGDRQGEAASLGNLGNAHYSLEQYQQAIDFHQQSLAITREIDDRQGEAASLGNLGLAYNALGQHQPAIDFIQQTLAITRNIGDRQGEAASLGNLGLAHNALGQYQQAIDFHQQYLAIAREIGDRQGEAIALNNLSLSLINTSQFSEAETTLTQSIGVYESLRINLSDDQLIAIADTQSQAYANLELALIAQNKTAEALAITERGRAQAFALQLALRQSDTPAAPITYPAIEDIQRIAREQNATLVSYSLIFNQALYIWVISPTGDIQFRSVDFQGDGAEFNPIATIDGPVYRGEADPSELDTLIADSRGGLTVVGGLPQERLKDLHQTLIAPIVDLLPADPEANVVFIPQGSLFLVPFAALQDADGTYLIEKHTITTAPSIQVLGLAAETATPAPGQPFSNPFVGNPVMPTLPNLTLADLPGAEAEAAAIGALLNLSPLLGEQATEAQVKAQMPSAQLIHLATHGLLDYRSSQFDIPGALAFTPGNGEDGLLTAGEILDMDLQAQLAILSACDTGRGRITGDGVVGLSRSLITAGVPSVVVSLWAVPDAPTAALMTEFYQQLSQGQPKAQALRQAMLTTLANHPEPRNWAAFTLIGNTQ